MTTWTPDLSHRDGPRYRAIADAMAAGLQNGELKPGDRLPTHRDLAYRLQALQGVKKRLGSVRCSASGHHVKNGLALRHIH